MRALLVLILTASRKPPEGSPTHCKLFSFHRDCGGKHPLEETTVNPEIHRQRFFQASPLRYLAGLE
jgi:hypothetical protein